MTISCFCRPLLFLVLVAISSNIVYYVAKAFKKCNIRRKERKKKTRIEAISRSLDQNQLKRRQRTSIDQPQPQPQPQLQPQFHCFNNQAFNPEIVTSRAYLFIQISILLTIVVGCLYYSTTLDKLPITYFSFNFINTVVIPVYVYITNSALNNFVCNQIQDMLQS